MNEYKIHLVNIIKLVLYMFDVKSAETGFNIACRVAKDVASECDCKEFIKKLDERINKIQS